MKKYSKILLFSFLFLFFLFWNLFIIDLYADEVWNYGFSYAIYKGLVPYQDFNMVITPLYPLLMAFSFSITSFNMIVFHVVNALILTGLCYFIYKLVGEKMWFVLIFLSFPMPNSFPSYNVFCLFLFVLLLYLEKEKKSDLLIGFIIGLSILTKQSIGVCLFLPSLYYIKDFKKFGKRIGGMMIPLVLFLCYLLFSHTLMDFLDLCLFGLFDFTKNQSSFNITYILVLISLLVILYWIRKDHKNIFIYYAFAMMSMVIPLFDLYHFQLFFLGLVLVYFMNHDIRLPFRVELLFFGIMIGVGLVQAYPKFQYGFVYPNQLRHFEYRYIAKPMVEYFQELNTFLDQYPDREVVYITNNAYLIRIERDEDISFVDLINYGNHGYGGNEKLLNLIKSKKDALFIVDKEELNPKKQTNKNVIHYVYDHGEKIDQIHSYEVYELKEE